MQIKVHNAIPYFPYQIDNDGKKMITSQLVRVWWSRTDLFSFTFFLIHNLLLLRSTIDPLRCEKMKYSKILANFGLKYVFPATQWRFCNPAAWSPRVFQVSCRKDSGNEESFTKAYWIQNTESDRGFFFQLHQFLISFAY